MPEDDTDARALRSRPGKMAASPSPFRSSSPDSDASNDNHQNYNHNHSHSDSKTPPATHKTRRRNPPPLPTPTERLLLLAYPAVLVFGTLFAALSPETRAAPYDAARQSYAYGDGAGDGAGVVAPSYFARKDNLLNVLFVKRGWAWVTAAFVAFVVAHPAFSSASSAGASSSASGSSNGNSTAAGARARRLRAAVRWALVTGWWVLVTQWCFGAPLIDRGFRFTGGRCEAVLSASSPPHADDPPAATEVVKHVFTAAACRAAGGSWRGGHDISGHVFLLVLGSCFLVQEVGYVVLRARWARARERARARGTTTAVGRRGNGGKEDERCVVMPDGAVKGAGVEDVGVTDTVGLAASAGDLGPGEKFAAVVVGLCLWMLLMTAIYFHTWFEKVRILTPPLLPFSLLFYDVCTWVAPLT